MRITFDGRIPHPSYASIGMDGEHNAEIITLDGLPEHDGKTVVLNIILPNGTADALAVTDGQVTITRNTTLPGTATAWVSILDGTDYVWKSEKIKLRVGELPDIDTPIEQQYPGIVEEAVKAIEEAGQLIGGVPSGGTTGQVLKKHSNTDGDVEWGDVDALPSGGSASQVLRKNSGNTGAEWGGYSVPSGGSSGQVLTKSSGSDGALTWSTPAGLPAYNYDSNKHKVLCAKYSSGPSWEYPGFTLTLIEHWIEEHPGTYMFNGQEPYTVREMFEGGLPLFVETSFDNAHADFEEADSANGFYRIKHMEHDESYSESSSIVYTITLEKIKMNGKKYQKILKFYIDEDYWQYYGVDVTPTGIVSNTETLTQAEYDALVQAGTVDGQTLYCIKESGS